LQFHREGKEWVISYGDYHPDMEARGESTNWKPLKDAPLKTKIFAFRMFSDLLVSIERSQDQLVNQMEEVVIEFDAFAERVGMKPKLQGSREAQSVPKGGVIMARDSQGRILRTRHLEGGK
jgi:hypothetical protein